MKLPPRCQPLYLATILACPAASQTEASVILDDAILTSDDFFFDYVISLSQSPDDGLFAIGIDELGADRIEFSYLGIAEEFALFQAFQGLELTPDYIDMTTPFISNNGIDPGSGSIELSLGQGALFGYWDELNTTQQPTSPGNFGWFNLTRTAAGLVISDGATAVGSGIIVGTTTPIPEPSPLGLMLALLLFPVVSRAR